MEPGRIADLCHVSLPCVSHADRGLPQASGIVRFLVLTVVYSLVKVRSTWPVVFMTTASSVFLIVKVYFYAGDFTTAWDYVMFGELNTLTATAHPSHLPANGLSCVPPLADVARFDRSDCGTALRSPIGQVRGSS